MSEAKVPTMEEILAHLEKQQAEINSLKKEMATMMLEFAKLSGEVETLSRRLDKPNQNQFAKREQMPLFEEAMQDPEYMRMIYEEMKRTKESKPKRGGWGGPRNQWSSYRQRPGPTTEEGTENAKQVSESPK